MIQVDGKGGVARLVMNDKCAAGTGRFLEVMAGALEVDFQEMSEISFQAKEQIEVSSTCTVFAESEIISLFAGGYPKPEVAAAVYRAISDGLAAWWGQVGLKERVAMTGGVAKGRGMDHAPEQRLGTSLLIPEEPQIIGALGAALFALDKV